MRTPVPGRHDNKHWSERATSEEYWCALEYTGWQWRNFDASWLSPPSCGKTVRNVLHGHIAEIRFVDDHNFMGISKKNQRYEFYPNNTINLRPLAPHHASCYVIPTKWRSYRGHRFCDVTPPYVYKAPLSSTSINFLQPSPASFSIGTAVLHGSPVCPTRRVADHATCGVCSNRPHLRDA